MSDYSIIVRKGQIFVKRWNSEIRAHEEKKRKEQILSDVLQYPITIEETTFGQFFSLIAKEGDLYERIFSAAMYRHPIGPYIEECEKEAKNEMGVDYVRINWFGDVYEGEMELVPSFDGYGDWPKVEGYGSPEKGGIALEFTPLYEYKNLMLKLDTKVIVGSLKSKEPLLKATKKFTVYDVINAILFEITWAGDISMGRENQRLAKCLKNAPDAEIP